MSQKDWTLEEEGLFVRLLRHAGHNSEHGKIFVTPEMGYSATQIASLCNIPEGKYKAILDKLIASERISVDKKGILSINNWATYQSEYERIKDYKGLKATNKATVEATKKATVKATVESTAPEAEAEAEVRSDKGLKQNIVFDLVATFFKRLNSDLEEDYKLKPEPVDFRVLKNKLRFYTPAEVGDMIPWYFEPDTPKGEKDPFWYTQDKTFRHFIGVMQHIKSYIGRVKSIKPRRER